MLLICIGSYGLFSAVRAEVAGAEGQCCRPHTGQVSGKVSTGGLPWPLWPCLLKLSQPVAELLALESVCWLLSWGVRVSRDVAE